MKLSFISAFSFIPSLMFKEAYSENVMVICDLKSPCPIGSRCIKVYGNSGICVLTKD